MRTRSPGRVLGRAPTPGQALPSARAALHPQEGVLGSVIDRGGLPLPGRTWPIFGIAFVGFATPVIGFVELAERVTDGAKLPFDRPVMLWLRRRHSSGTTRFVRAVTELGRVTAVPVFALAAAGYLAYVRGSRRPAALLTVSLVGSTIINSVLKVMYRRARPTFFAHIVQEKSYSFPSGHAMASAALAGCACVLAWPTRWRYPVIAASSVYVPTIGLSRMYLGVHFPSDILAGWCVSLAWVGEVATIMWLVDRLDIPIPEVADLPELLTGGTTTR